MKQQRVVLPGRVVMHKHTRTFIEQQDIFILIDNIKPRMHTRKRLGLSPFLPAAKKTPRG